MLSKCNSNDEIKRDSWFDVLMGRRWFFLDAWCRQLCTVVWYFPHVEIRSSLAMTSFEVSIFPLFTEESFQASSSQRLFGRRGRRNFRGAFWSSYFMMSVSWSFRKIATFFVLRSSGSWWFRATKQIHDPPKYINFCVDIIRIHGSQDYRALCMSG